MGTDCPHCGGTGFEYEDHEGQPFARPCQCRRTPRDMDPLSICKIPPRYAHCTLANFDLDPQNRSQVAALQKSLNYCSGFPHKGKAEEGLGLLYVGDTGVGKTHLAVGVLKELVSDRGVNGQYWDFMALTREIKRSYDPDIQMTEHAVLAPVIEMDLLLLDDLGAWKMSDWMLDTLFYVLNGRYMSKRPTLITTNFQDVDRETALRADPLLRKEFLVERIGQRLRSRLQEMCAVLKIEGPDHRAAAQHGHQDALTRARHS
jgi:DNA replication protein DnaC